MKPEDVERFRLFILTYLNEGLIDDLAGDRELETSFYTSFVRDQIAVIIKQEVYGERAGTLEIKTPKTWVQMLKESHAPWWFKRRFPVRYRIDLYEAKVLYPKVSFPKELHTRVWDSISRRADG